jgi:hypothetical protein
MLTTTRTALAQIRSCAPVRPASECTAMINGLAAAGARLDAALDDLRTLVSTGDLCADAAVDLERDYVARHLRRVAELEQRGALACTPEEWQRFVTAAARRTSAARRSADRRERARRERTTRHCLAVASGRIDDPWIAALDSVEPDPELRAIRADLAAAHLL